LSNVSLNISSIIALRKKTAKDIHEEERIEKKDELYFPKLR